MEKRVKTFYGFTGTRHFKIRLKPHSQITKGIILSIVAQISDPVFIRFCSVESKTFLADTVEGQIREGSGNFVLLKEVMDLDCLRDIRVSCKTICKNPRDTEIHCFCDV